MPFGEHRGKSLSQLPDEYLEWLTTIDLCKPPCTAVHAEISARHDPVKHDPTLGKAVINLGFRQLGLKGHPGCGGTNNKMQLLNSTLTWLRRQLEVLA